VAAVDSTMRPEASLNVSRPDERTLMLRLVGSWTLHDRLPGAADIDGVLDEPPPAERVAFDTADLGRWDSGLLTFLLAFRDAVHTRPLPLIQRAFRQACRA
jgi:hypothetical protein